MAGGGGAARCPRLRQPSSSRRPRLRLRSCAGVQPRRTTPSSSAASARCSSRWICSLRRRRRSVSSASLRCSRPMSSCGGRCCSVSLHHARARGIGASLRYLQQPSVLNQLLSPLQRARGGLALLRHVQNIPAGAETRDLYPPDAALLEGSTPDFTLVSFCWSSFRILCFKINILI